LIPGWKHEELVGKKGYTQLYHIFIKQTSIRTLFYPCKEYINTIISRQLVDSLAQYDAIIHIEFKVFEKKLVERIAIWNRAIKVQYIGILKQ